VSYDLFEAPDGITPLVGYRGWTYKDGKLSSCYRAVEWPIGGPLLSECIHPTYIPFNDRGAVSPQSTKKHVAPFKDCTCGIYALNEYSPRSYVDESGKHRKKGKPWPNDSIVGVILGWGRIVMGTKGFRCEYAKPIALMTRPRSPKWTTIISELAETYGLELLDPQGGYINGYREV